MSKGNIPNVFGFDEVKFLLDKAFVESIDPFAG